MKPYLVLAAAMWAPFSKQSGHSQGTLAGTSVQKMVGLHFSFSPTPHCYILLNVIFSIICALNSIQGLQAE